MLTKVKNRMEIIGLIVSALPIAELRGGIPLAIASGMRPLYAFLLCVIINILIMFPLFFFLDHLHVGFMKWGFYRRLFLKYIHKSRRKLSKYVGTKWEFLALLLLVAIPLPATGVYTGTILAWLFDIKRKEAYLALAFGVALAGVIVSLATLGVLSLF